MPEIYARDHDELLLNNKANIDFSSNEYDIKSNKKIYYLHSNGYVNQAFLHVKYF